jgi:hypothetical protein
LFLAVGVVVSVHAWSKDYLMELTITTDKQDEFVFLEELDERQFRDLRNNTNFEVKKYLVLARRKYADEIGYRKEIYGKENYKMVVISSYKLIVKDKSTGRILLKK